MSHLPPIARERCRVTATTQEDGEADHDAEADEAERRERLDADLDEEVAGAPRERERAEEDGVRRRGSRRAGVAAGRRAGSERVGGRGITGGVCHASCRPRRPPGPTRAPIPRTMARHACPSCRLSSNGVSLGVFYPFIAVILAVRNLSPAGDRPDHRRLVGRLHAGGPGVGPCCGRDPWPPARPHVSALGAAAVLLAGAPMPRWPWPPLRWVQPFECAWGPLGDALAVNAMSDHPRDYARIRLLSSIGSRSSRPRRGLLYNLTGYGPRSCCVPGSPSAWPLPRGRAPDVERADLDPVSGQSRGGSFGGRPADPASPALVLLATLLSTSASSRASPTCPFACWRSAADLRRGPAAGGRLRGDPGHAPGRGDCGAGPHPRPDRRQHPPLRSVLRPWALLDIPLLIAATRLATGFSFAGIWVGSVLTMAVLLPPRLQATGQGHLPVTGFGVAAVLANVFGGFLYGLGSPVLFILAPRSSPWAPRCWPTQSSRGPVSRSPARRTRPCRCHSPRRPRRPGARPGIGPADLDDDT